MRPPAPALSKYIMISNTSYVDSHEVVDTQSKVSREGREVSDADFESNGGTEKGVCAERNNEQAAFNRPLLLAVSRMRFPAAFPFRSSPMSPPSSIQLSIVFCDSASRTNGCYEADNFSGEGPQGDMRDSLRPVRIMKNKLMSCRTHPSSSTARALA